MIDISYRPARSTDAAAIAQLTMIAADGLVDFLLADLVPNTSSEELLSSLIAQEQGEASYRNTEVAVMVEQVIGIAQSYAATRHRITDEMRDFLPAERLEHLTDFFNSRVEDSWFLDTLAVAPAYQGQGIGRQLIERVKQQARDQGYPSVSLIAWADNQDAIRLYQRQEFQPVKSIQVTPHPLLPHSGAILFNCRLS